MPLAMSLGEEKTLPGADVLLALLGLATVATSRALGQTRWIEDYRAEMRTALGHFDQAVALAPDFPDVHFRRGQTLRHLGETGAALEAARHAVNLAPNNNDYAAFLRVLEGSTGAAVPRRSGPAMSSNSSSGSTVKPPPVISERPGHLSWDDVILPARTKRELRQMQLVLENPQQARTLGVEPPTGLLLYGPPGTGKTTVARVLAAQAKCRFYATSPAEINNMWMGESEKAVARLFDDARKHAPSIIFVDEIDALLANRTGGMNQYSDKVVNQFLHEMDGLKPNTGVFVVGATNRPDMLDAALVRGGRLSRQIEIPLPDEAGRLAILHLNTRSARLDPAMSLPLLAEETEGFSGADLRALVNEAGLQALIRLADEGGPELLTPEDFAVAIDNIRREE